MAVIRLTGVKKRLGRILWGVLVLGLLGGGATFLYVTSWNRRIDERIEQLRSTRASLFYALYPPLRLKQRFTAGELKNFLLDQGYLENKNAEDLLAQEYVWEREPRGLTLTLFRPAFEGAGLPLAPLKVRLKFEEIGNQFLLIEMVKTENQEPLEVVESLPKKIGAFFAGRLRTQNSVTLSDIPTSVRLAVMAIEDVNFLEHGGISLRSTLRALWRDLRARRWVEGGSTITQQLMKNLFFSREKALSRKIKEAIFAFLTEARYEKETILEAYLNEVYLGQWSTHELHGVSEGASYYFNRPISQLSLPQGATLAAIIQAPNAQDPHRYPERTLKRRNLVLKKMLDAGFIEPGEYEMAQKEPLGVVPFERGLHDVDYANDLVMNELSPDMARRLDTDALTIYVTLNPYFQAAASKAISANLARLQDISPAIRKREKKGIRLQSALIAIDPRECTVLAVQGGRSYRQTQFNRVVQGRRQPGSLFKPFVYLAAFEQTSASPPFTSLTEIEDSPLEWKYDAQIWKPKNYDEIFRGPVTLRQALEESLNVPTAKLAQKVGMPAIVEAMVAAGIKTPLPPLPSLSLGSAEVSPLELAEAYTTLANLGMSCKLRTYLKVFDENKNLVIENDLAQERKIPALPAFQTVQLLKGVLTHGTARSTQASGLPLSNFAGKTGTTNEAKDAWFVGFSPDLLVLVWVGYDEEEKVGLTGSVAALPLWVDFIRSASPFLLNEDFAVPEGLRSVEVDRKSHGVATPRCPERQTEYFLPGTEPRSDCRLHP